MTVQGHIFNTALGPGHLRIEYSSRPFPVTSYRRESYAGIVLWGRYGQGGTDLLGRITC